jgi:endonuclease/exonuclease/phosphatase (EEP) superfamily protein YafD
LIWAAATPLALWALVRTFGLETGVLLTGLMWFTPYAAVAALLVTGVAVALRNWVATAVTAIATVALALAVLPRTIGTETTPADGHETLTVLAANVYLGDADPAGLIELIDRYRPDLLSVEELTPSFVAELRRMGIERRLPYSVLMPRPHGRGGGLYARYPLRPLAFQTAFAFRMPRAMLTLPDGSRFRVIAVHPPPPNMGYEDWQRPLESLPSAGTGVPWVLAGDFNSTLDQAEFRQVVDSGYRDAGDATGKGLEPTWPSSRVFPWGLMTIDHILADRRLGIADYGVEGLPGSDHRAIHAQLVLPGPPG